MFKFQTRMNPGQLDFDPTTQDSNAFPSNDGVLKTCRLGGKTGNNEINSGQSPTTDGKENGLNMYKQLQQSERKTIYFAPADENSMKIY
jgi:hypothetical protein